MIALIDAFDRLCQTRTDVERIRELAQQVRAKADESIQESAELAEAIRQMEEQYETLAEPAASVGGNDGGEDALPSPGDLLRDVEAFLNRAKDDPQ
jgi:hypothetical protein